MKRLLKTRNILLYALLLALAASGINCGGGGGGAADIIQTIIGNDSPEFDEVSIPDSTVLAIGEGVLITARATDPDGDDFIYSWSATGGNLSRISSTQYEFSASEPGSYTITIKAIDEFGGVGEARRTIRCYGDTYGDGGIAGSLNVPRTSYRQNDGPTESGNTLSVPLQILPAQGRDLSRRVASKPASVPCSLESFVPGEVIVELNSGVMTQFAAANGFSVKKQSPSGMALLSVNVAGLSDSAALEATRAACVQLNAKSGVRYADLNGKNSSMAIPNDPYYSDQWHYPLINLPQAWDVTTGSSNVIVAVLDTGIVSAHPDISGKLVSGYDFVTDTYGSCDGDGLDSDPEDVADSRCIGRTIRPQDPSHSGYHGTHVAGTIGASSNNGLGVAGVDWGARIMPLRVLGADGGTDYDISQAMLYAAGLSNDSGTVPAQTAKVINLSLGGYPGGTCSSTLNNAFEKVYNAGVTVFVAAGNEYSTDAINPVALCAHAIAVGAVDRTSTVSPYSNHGPGLTIAAPGGNQYSAESDGVLSTIRNDSTGTASYKYYQGTSMATPHAAGVAALMLGANSALSVDQITTLMTQTATDLGSTGTDTTYGAGLVNAYQAVVEAKKLGGIIIEPTFPELSVSTEKLYFGVNDSSHSIILTNTGGGTLQVTGISNTENSGGDWMSTSTSTNSGTITLTVNVDRTGLNDGTYTGSISIESNGGNATVAVTLQVSSVDPAPPEGCIDSTIYILAVSSSGCQTLAQAEVGLSDSAYQIYDVPGGDYYYVVGGTDCNGDNYICDQDIDVCGAYPLLEDPDLVYVASQELTSGVDFTLTTMGGATARPAGGALPGLTAEAFKRLK